MKLRAVGDGTHLGPSEAATQATNALPDMVALEEELDAMLTDIKALELDLPDEVIRVCTGFMARCTELHLRLIRNGSRAANWTRTQQLAKVMELIEFTYRAASRIIEIHRQDVEMSR